MSIQLCLLYPFLHSCRPTQLLSLPPAQRELTVLPFQLGEREVCSLQLVSNCYNIPCAFHLENDIISHRLNWGLESGFLLLSRPGRGRKLLGFRRRPIPMYQDKTLVCAIVSKVHFQRRRTGILRHQGVSKRTPPLPRLSSSPQAKQGQRRSASRALRHYLRWLWSAGPRALPAQPGSPRLLRRVFSEDPEVAMISTSPWSSDQGLLCTQSVTDRLGG